MTDMINILDIEILRDLNLISISFRVFLAILLGGLSGLERGLKNRPAGLRTYMLVSLGACIVSITNVYIYEVYAISDPVRMPAQVISGIGFLGAGTIIVTRRNQIKGLTTAAGLWTSATIGIAIGIGFYEVVILAQLMMFLILSILHRFDNKIHRRAKVVEVFIELRNRCSMKDFLKFLKDERLHASNLQTESESAFSPNTLAFIVTIKSLDDLTQEDVVNKLKVFQGIKYFEEL